MKKEDGVLLSIAGTGGCYSLPAPSPPALRCLDSYLQNAWFKTEKIEFSDRQYAISAGCDENINNHRLICIPIDNKAYGLGFMIHDRWKNNIAKVWKVSERISVTQFNITSKKIIQ